MSYPVFIPFFIGGSTDRGLFKGLVIGLACVFFIAPNLAVFVVEQNGSQCPTLDPKDSKAVKDWKQSCYDFEHNLTFNLPIITGVLASALLILGYVRLRISDRPTLGKDAQ